MDPSSPAQPILVAPGCRNARAGSICPHLSPVAGGFCTYLGLWGAAGGWLHRWGALGAGCIPVSPGITALQGRNFLYSGQKYAVSVTGRQREGYARSQAGPAALLSGYLASSVGQVSRKWGETLFETLFSPTASPPRFLAKAPNISFILPIPRREESGACR